MDACWLTQAEKVARPPSSHLFDLDKEPLIWNCFLKWFTPHRFTHAHKNGPGTVGPKLQSPHHCNRSFHLRSFSTDCIQPQTLCQAPTKELTQSKAKAYTLTFRGALVTQCTEANNVQNLQRARITPANWSSLPSPPPVPSKNRSERVSSCGDAKGRKVKQRTGRTVLSRSKILWGDSWQKATMAAAGQSSGAVLGLQAHGPEHQLCRLWAVPGQDYLVFSTMAAQLWDPQHRWTACSLQHARGNPAMALARVLLQTFFLPDKHWKDCTAFHRGLPHHRRK